MTIFYLVRHGTRESRDEATHLSALGVHQAQLTAAYLADKNVHKLMSSPLLRTQQTAKIISEKIALPVLTDERLTERMNYDFAKGKTFEEFLDEWNKTMEDRSYDPPYGESSLRSGQRLQSVLDEIENDCANVLVAHGGVIGDVLRNIFGDDDFTFLTDPGTSRKWIGISECSITEVHKDDGKYFLKRVNDTSHLSQNKTAS